MDGEAVPVRPLDELRGDDPEAELVDRDLEGHGARWRRRARDDVVGRRLAARREPDLRAPGVEVSQGCVVEGPDDDVGTSGPVDEVREQLTRAQVRVQVAVPGALDLDVDRRVREGSEDLVERGNGEVVGRVAVHDDVTVPGAAERVGVRRLAVDRATPGDEPVGGVEALDLGERHVDDPAAPFGRPVHRGIVDDDEPSVLGALDVELEHVGPQRLGSLEGVEGVHRGLVLAAGVRHVHHPHVEPRVDLLGGG